MKRLGGLVLLMALLLLVGHVRLYAADSKPKWQGVDESVVEKVAREHGREAHTPLINTDQGDLLLFVFLIAGAVGGFVAGYYWKSLMERRDAPEEQGGE